MNTNTLPQEGLLRERTFCSPQTLTTSSKTCKLHCSEEATLFRSLNNAFEIFAQLTYADGIDFTETPFQLRLAELEHRAGIRPAADLQTDEDRAEQFHCLDSIVGNTPLLRMSDGLTNGSIILGKMEARNPSESHYDRAYLLMIKRLEADGVIAPGDELRDITSGSSGNSLAYLGNRLGYQVRLIVPAQLPIGRIIEMYNFGAEVKLVSGYVLEASQAQRAELIEFTRNRQRPIKHKGEGYDSVLTTRISGGNICYLNHSQQELAPQAFSIIADEVREVLPLGIHLTHFVSILGNGTTTCGISESLRTWNPNVSVIGVEDSNQPVQYSTKYPDLFLSMHPINGIYPGLIRASGNDLDAVFGQQTTFGASQRGVPLRFMDTGLLDSIRLVHSKRAQGRALTYNKDRPWTQTLGTSSAMGLAVAEDIAGTNPGSIVLMIIHDHADRYLPEVLTSIQAGHKAIAADRVRIGQPGWQQPVAISPPDLPTSLADSRAGGSGDSPGL
ncbi:MAG: pyridoxal-phosphate dependent enzyme [Candidatus Dormibacteraceae bacterium]